MLITKGEKSFERDSSDLSFMVDFHPPLVQLMQGPQNGAGKVRSIEFFKNVLVSVRPIEHVPKVWPGKPRLPIITCTQILPTGTEFSIRISTVTSAC